MRRVCSQTTVPNPEVRRGLPGQAPQPALRERVGARHLTPAPAKSMCRVQTSPRHRRLGAGSQSLGKQIVFRIESGNTYGLAVIDRDGDNLCR